MFTNSTTKLRLVVLTAFVLTFVIATPLAASDRTVVPTPAGGGDGVSHVQADSQLKGTPGAVRIPRARPDDTFIPTSRAGDIGGDDVRIMVDDYVGNNSLDIATNGDIYAAVEVEGSNGLEIVVQRSTDSGSSWAQWAVIRDLDSNIDLKKPCLRIGEGAANRCFVGYIVDEGGADRNEIHVAYSDLSPTGSFATDHTVMSSAGLYPHSFHMATDEPSWNSYFLYLVAEAGDDDNYGGDSNDIWFVRSTNQGTSFESPYAIATLSTTDRDYRLPKVVYGFGGLVHVTWHFESRTGLFDSAVRYRRAETYANGGLSAWNDVEYVSSTTNGIDEEEPLIAASTAGDEVVITHRRYENPSIYNCGVIASSDAGVSFPSADEIPAGLYFTGELIYQESTDQFIMVGNRGDDGIQRASASSPLSWSYAEYFGDRDYWNQTGMTNRWSIALDPTHGDRAAMLWSHTDLFANDDSLYFDAEWHRDPGYPNYEDGFPLALEYSAITEPVVVDLNGDGNQEIIFADTGRYIRVYRHDGTELDGWPILMGDTMADGSIAVGDLNLDGTMTLVVGTDLGQVFAFTPQAELIDGWPYSMPSAIPIQVSIGAVGAIYPRSIIAVGGSSMRVLGSRGQTVNYPWGWEVTGYYAEWPAAIGDVDGDGDSDIVCTFGNRLVVIDRADRTIETIVVLADTPSEAVSLGDIDLDGDVEIAVPMPDGTLHMFHADGTEHPGWPYVSALGSAMSRPAFANCLGTSDLEIATVERNWTAHMIYETGSEHPSWPVTGTTWYMYGSPILDMCADQFSADLVIGARGSKAWAWSNSGSLLDGWPKSLDDNVYLSPAAGDLDQDGSLEIVLLTDTELVVLDVHQTPGYGSRVWSQYGHDARRSGCSDCPEDMVTAIGDNEQQVTRVSFAGAAPNPVTSGGTVFSFSTPVRSAVEIVIHDIRGRRVRTVSRREVEMGHHVAAWDGYDDDGQTLASGRYLATLKVRGPGVRQELTRKVTVLR